MNLTLVALLLMAGWALVGWLLWQQEREHARLSKAAEEMDRRHEARR